MVKTARDLLLGDILTLIRTPFSAISPQSLTQKLDHYRVQAKPDSGLQANATARDLLGAELTQAWQKADLTQEKLKRILGRYRMQLKSKGAMQETSPKEPRLSKKKLASKAIPEKKAVSSATKFIRSEPLAGGPQKRVRSRGECPKCRSIGVVLARSFGDDEYFSCIYCGFQAYRATLDSELDLPLAAQLLGRRFDEKEEMDGFNLDELLS